MGIRTDISEDAKGDPSKVIPQQPEPSVLDEEPTLPILPPRNAGEVPRPRPGAQTPADRKGLAQRGPHRR